MWTKFFDMSSGGGEKLGASVIWIEAGYDGAVELFEGIFDRDPCNVTCQCCGSDYSIDECEIDAGSGDWIVSANDILRFKNGDKLEYVN